jgi:hypothetical protein
VVCRFLQGGVQVLSGPRGWFAGFFWTLHAQIQAAAPIASKPEFEHARSRSKLRSEHGCERLVIPFLEKNNHFANRTGIVISWWNMCCMLHSYWIGRDC